MRALLLLLPILLAAPEDPWERLPAVPGRGEWRGVFPEPGQDFAEYRASGPVRGGGGRDTIYVQPWLTRPPADPRLLDDLAQVLEAFYVRTVVVRAPRPVPARAHTEGDPRLGVPALAAALLLDLPDDALFVLGVTDRDLELGDLAFAWGWGSFRHRVGVMTTHGLRETPDAGRRRRRLVGLAIHECGHMLSMAHCVEYRCGMNGTRTVREADRRPLLFCPVCHSKLCWNLGLDPARRDPALIRALETRGLAGDAAFARRAAAHRPPVPSGPAESPESAESRPDWR